MAAYYNEIDPYAAAWLRNLVAAGHIADGEVDERDIRDVTPADLAGFTQCHFFAGIGVWSYALRRGGWPDDRPVWTGSCPCQPFSAAGKRGGFDDERHLWPSWHWLIGQCRPVAVLGEQVASKDGLAWLDLVRADLEGTGYAFGAVDLCAAGIGAPHIRQRAWFVANADDEGSQGRGQLEPRRFAGGGVADASQPEWHGSGPDGQADWGAEHSDGGGASERPGPTNGFWRDADWLRCRDGKWRPVEARPQPLADGVAESLGRVRPEILAQATEVVNACAAESQVEPDSLLRDVCQMLSQKAKRLWPAGGLPGLPEAPFLLSFLCQLAAQRWDFAQSVSLSCQKTARLALRGVRDESATTGASRQRRLDEQQSEEYSDAVHLLSSFLARITQAAWGDAYAAYTEIGFPLGHGSFARVGRLRAYGNALNAEAATEFVRSVV